MNRPHHIQNAEPGSAFASARWTPPPWRYGPAQRWNRPLRSDDGQVGEVQPRVFLCAVGKLQAPQVEFAQAFQGRVQPCTVRLGAGAAQALGQHLGVHEALDHGPESSFLQPLRLRQFQGFLDHRVVQRPLGRKDLRDDDQARAWSPSALVKPPDALFDSVPRSARPRRPRAVP